MNCSRWDIQENGDAELLWQEVDVERECLDKLEEEMFERSKAAGIAGEWQWGLDAGDHQDAWDPYDGLPYHWIHAEQLENYEDNEKASDNCQCSEDVFRKKYSLTQLQVEPGPNFINIEKPTVLLAPGTKPRARPRKKTKNELE